MQNHEARDNIISVFSFLSLILYVLVFYLDMCMPVLHMHAWSLLRPEEDVGNPGTGVQVVVNAMWCWELNLSPLRQLSGPFKV